MKNVLKERKKVGLSQSELSRLCGIAQSAISDLERGKVRSISVHAALRMESALKTSIYKLFPPTNRHYQQKPKKESKGR